MRLFLNFIYLILFVFIFSVPAEAQKSHRILHMPPNKIADFIVSTKGDKRVVMIYTSWCPVCRQIMPKVMDLENVRPGSVIAISEDQDHPKFISYINKYKHVPFMIFLSRPTKSVTLPAMLQKKLGVKPWDGYPHFILLDGENMVVQQGNFDAEQLADFLLSKGDTE